MEVADGPCRTTSRDAHFANTLVQIDISLNALDLINSELEYPPLAIFRSSLLFGNVKGAL